MLAVEGRFDGKRVVLPSLPHVHECPVIVVFEADTAADTERAAWLKLQEAALSRAWDNDEDAVYDKL